MNADRPTSEPTQSEQRSDEGSRDLEEIRRMGEERLEDLRELGGEIRRRLEDEVKNRPLVALGVAFGAGAVVSSLLTSRLARLAVLAAGGYAAREMFGDRLIEVIGAREDRVPRDEDEPRHRGRRSSKGSASG